MFFNIRFQRSTAPLLSGGSGVENRGEHPSRSINSLVRLAVKFVPQSELITLGTPVLANTVSSASQVTFAVSDLRQTTSGQRVHKSTMHNAYRYPRLEGGSIGPIMSMFTFWNGYFGRFSGAIGTWFVCRLSDLTWHP